MPPLEHSWAHLPGFACWPGRSLVDQALAGDLDRLAGMAFAQTCDMVQALTDIWRKVMPGVPVYHVGVPLNLAARSAVMHYVAAQIEDFITWSEEQVGRKMDSGHFMHTLELSREAINLWTEIRELGTHRPSPLNVPDLFLAMAPIVVLRGTRRAVDFYRLMKAEVEQRVAEGVAA
jgi:benzoyl-CoA reductase/2-hydroxyglutaryl-CoA dehydratase subunit BcrC/BadD/HgdB